MKGLQVDGLRKLRSGKMTKTNMNVVDQNTTKVLKSKRAAMESPKEAPVKKKRSAFGDITNAVVNGTSKLTSKKSKLPTQTKAKIVVENAKNVLKAQPAQVQTTEPASVSEKKLDNRSDAMFSDSFSWTDKDFDTLLTLTDDSPCSSSKTPMPANSEALDTPKDLTSTEDKTKQALEEAMRLEWRRPSRSDKPADVRCIDKDEDPSCVSEYVDSIFNVMKHKEGSYIIRKYIDNNSVITPHMRAILVDWLVEVQENFELHHETLYLAVKLVDHYLQANNVTRDKLQLVAASALFISCKLEERYAPPLDDFVFICDDAYRNEEFITMEGKILCAVDYDLNIPISYRFLRRYARIAATSMETLTLARYVLELALHEHDLVDSRDSLIAAAALNLAFKMTKSGTWDSTLSYYAGYEENELYKLMQRLNTSLKMPPKKGIKTVINKYSHSVFFQVAKIPALNSIPGYEKVTTV